MQPKHLPEPELEIDYSQMDEKFDNYPVEIPN